MARIYVNDLALAVLRTGPLKLKKIIPVDVDLWRIALTLRAWIDLQGEIRPKETISETIIRIYGKGESND